MLVALLAIAGATLTIAASWAGGSVFWRIAKLPTVGGGGKLEQFALELAVGAAFLATAIFGLCAIHLVYPAVFAAMWCGIGLAWARWGGLGGARIEGSRAPMGVPGWLGCSILVSYLGIYFVYALAPETAPDAVAYHLGLIRQYVLAHGFSAITTNIYAFLPMGTEMLFLNAYVIGAHSAAKLVHWALTGATVFLILGFAERQGHRSAGWVAAVLYVCSPALSFDATSAYNDCALAFFTFAVFAALARWWDRPHDGTLIAAGVLAGFCFAVKFTGGMALLGAAGTVLLSTIRRTGKLTKALRDVFVLCGVAAIFMAPWLLKNVVVTGNPVSPLFNAWFPNPYVTEVWEQIYREDLRHFNGFGRAGWIDYATAPLELTIWGSKVTGIVGPAFLLLPAALLGWRSGLVRALGAAAVLAGLPWLSNAGARFVIPALPFAALLVAMYLERLPRRLVTPAAFLVITSHALLSWPYVLDDWHPAWTWRIEPPIPWEAALRLLPEEEYLAMRIDAYTMIRRIDQVAQPGDRVLSLEQLPEAYMDTPVVVCYQGAQAEQMYRALRAPTDQSLWPLDRISVRFASRERITGFRVMTTNSDEAAEWAISELQLLDGAKVLSPSRWHTDADPFPWNAGLIADGDDVSTWYSGRILAPEMRVEVLLGRPIHATEAVIIHPVRQRLAQLEYRYRTQDGKWRAATGEFQASGNDLDAARLKEWAGWELKRSGITMLLVNTTAQAHNFITPSIVEDPSAWGFQEVLREGSRILYRVAPGHTQPGYTD